MIRFVTEKDFDIWFELAKEVEPLFGKMVEYDDFRMGIKECIKNDSAFCCTHNGNIEGIIAVNKIENEIIWFAVKSNCRGKGYGYQLLKTAIDSLDNDKNIFVQTFSSNIKDGEAARKLYMKLGFKDFKNGGKNPAGIDTIIMKLEKTTI